MSHATRSRTRQETSQQERISGSEQMDTPDNAATDPTHSTPAQHAHHSPHQIPVIQTKNRTQREIERETRNRNLAAVNGVVIPSKVPLGQLPDQGRKVQPEIENTLVSSATLCFFNCIDSFCTSDQKLLNFPIDSLSSSNTLSLSIWQTQYFHGTNALTFLLILIGLLSPESHRTVITEALSRGKGAFLFQDQSRNSFTAFRLLRSVADSGMSSGSTPGLIDPTLGEIPGNRIPLPGLGIPEQRRAETSSESTDDDSSSRSMHSVQALPNVQPTQAPQNDQHRTPQTSYDHWEHQAQEPAQAGSSNITTAPFPPPSTITDSPAARFAGASPASETHRTQAWVDAQALDAAAMPPPPSTSLRQNVYPDPRTSADFPAIPSRSSPYEPRNSQFPDPQTFSFQGPATPLPQFTRPKAFVDEEMPELPIEEDCANMSARLDEAMAEIDWVSDPVLGIAAVLSNIPPIDRNLAMVEDFELDFVPPAQGENTVPDPSQAQQLQNEAEHNPPELLVQQGIKRKDDDEGNEDLQGVQLDERQGRRLGKRMRLLPGSNIRSNQQVSNPNAASSSRQQWQRRAPRSEEYQSPYSQEQSFGGPTPFRARPLSQASVEQTFVPPGGNPYQERNVIIAEQSRASYSDHHPWISSPFMPTVATGAQTRDTDIWKFLSIDPPYTRPHVSNVSTYGTASQVTNRLQIGFNDSLQDDQIIRRPPGTFSPRPALQPSFLQPAVMRSRSRADRGGPAEASFHNNLYAGDMLRPTSAVFPSTPTSQPPMSENLSTRHTSKADRSRMRNEDDRESGYGCNPYDESH
ncbi:hypothetical protein BDR22DRAFT_885452 [Usnea florida]